MQQSLQRSDGPESSNGTILIVDDEPALLQIMEAIISSTGLRCLSTTEVSTALAILAVHSEIDVIVSDLRMPRIDGLQFLESKREFLYTF